MCGDVYWRDITVVTIILSSFSGSLGLVFESLQGNVN
jgi:hypothetical protein